MEALEALKIANTYKNLKRGDFDKSVNINLITNFTDEVLQKILIGQSVSHGIYPVINPSLYKQYNFLLRDKDSLLYKNLADITFIFFDVSHYVTSAFSFDPNHFTEVIEDIVEYAKTANGPVVVCNLISPYNSPHGNLFMTDSLFNEIQNANKRLMEISRELENFYVYDVNRLVSLYGELNVRDFRGIYSYDIPFNNDFLFLLGKELFNYVLLILGRSKKCLVLDLDGTLWGGVVGEVGPLAVSVGPGYPGSIFEAFQRAVLGLYNRGVILAINSKNNFEDAMEVFEKNKNMVLKKEHFSSMKINWVDKATNLLEIAGELNIGLDSIVFLDDDKFNRELVRSELPAVFTPDFPMRQEDYVHWFFSLNQFTQFKITEEDKKRGETYFLEGERRKIRDSSGSIDEYIKNLNIGTSIEKNNKDLVPRLSQMTLKTNQFNLTTKRYTEKDILRFIDDNSLVYSGDVSDKFGGYGVTIMAIVFNVGPHIYELDNFLMSCRIIGRKVEISFLDNIITDLIKNGAEELRGTFDPTSKNQPARDFLASMGFELINGDINDGLKKIYRLDLSKYEIHRDPNSFQYANISQNY